MAMRDHLRNGTATRETIAETAKEEIVLARSVQTEALERGDTYTAGLMSDAIDVHLDRLAENS